MSSTKYLFLIIILGIGMISLGCVGKKPAEKGTAIPSQQTVAPTQPVSTHPKAISENDLNTIENNLNNLDITFNDSSEIDNIDLGVSESSFT